MNMYDIILKKRNGGILSKEEIEFFVEGFTKDEIPDYQASALLMTFFFNNLNNDEVFALTDAMKNSGDNVDLSGIDGIKVDKHSTGGVGDKTTLIVAPLAAACGVPIAKMSGRGLGFTGGTVDKMESIPGMKTILSEEEFKNQVNSIGISVIGQTGHIAPADKKIYALRDVTATVDNLGLIASSVMSKKLAAGSDAFVLDVKCGKGAFMESVEAATELASIMVEIGNNAGKKTVAVITDMNQPLGNAVGNSLEVIEAIETLKGKGPDDITELSIELATQMVLVGDVLDSNDKSNYDVVKKMVINALKSGKALEKLRKLISAQGGDSKVIDDYSLFGSAKYSVDITANDLTVPESNNDEVLYINSIDAGAIGTASQRSGAGRATKDDVIDMTAGIILNKKVGDKVKAGETIMTIYGNSQEKINEAKDIAITSIEIKSDPPIKEDLIKKIIKRFLIA